MTTQVRKFIDLSDVKAVTLRCVHCESTLTIPSSRDISRHDAAGKFSTCPVCLRPWGTSSGGTCEPLMATLLANLNTLRAALADAKGFTLALEISSDPASDAKGD